jgi:hypothetical protein
VAASSSSGALSVMMCASSRSPIFGFSGTTGTPATSALTTAAHVSIVGVAHTATRVRPLRLPTSLPATPASCR